MEFSINLPIGTVFGADFKYVKKSGGNRAGEKVMDHLIFRFFTLKYSHLLREMLKKHQF